MGNHANGNANQFGIGHPYGPQMGSAILIALCLYNVYAILICINRGGRAEGGGRRTPQRTGYGGPWENGGRKIGVRRTRTAKQSGICSSIWSTVGFLNAQCATYALCVCKTRHLPRTEDGGLRRTADGGRSADDIAWRSENGGRKKKLGARSTGQRGRSADATKTARTTSIL